MGLFIAVCSGLTAFNFLVKRPRKKRFADFYKNYDAEKAAERMRDAGLLQSTPPLPPDPKAHLTVLFFILRDAEVEL